MNRFRLALIAAAACCSASVAVARPIIGFHGTCTFNGVSEACFVREDTESFEVTYASDNKCVIYCCPTVHPIQAPQSGPE